MLLGHFNSSEIFYVLYSSSSSSSSSSSMKLGDTVVIKTTLIMYFSFETTITHHTKSSLMEYRVFKNQNLSRYVIFSLNTNFCVFAAPLIESGNMLAQSDWL